MRHFACNFAVEAFKKESVESLMYKKKDFEFRFENFSSK